MREIKFRAWDKDMRTMKSPRTMSDLMTADPICASVIEDYTFEQFTGLTDKAGVGIYEGDILKCIYTEDSTDTVYTLVGAVEWDEFMCEYLAAKDDMNNRFKVGTVFTRDSKIEQFEIIGNIHENPELLEQ